MGVRWARLPLGLFAVCLSLQGQTEAKLWRYLHPDAKAVIGVDWSRFQQSEIWGMLQQRMGTLPLPVKGMPFLKDIDRIVLSSPGAPDGGKGEAPLLIAIHGHFAPDSVRRALVEQGAHKQIYGKFAIYRPQGKGTGQDLGFVIVDVQTVLIGDIPSLCATLDRSEFTPVTPGTTMIRAAELDAANDFWAVISNPNILGSQRLQGFLSGDDLSDLGRGLEFGMNFRDGFALNVSLKTASEAMAKHLVDQISVGIKLGLKDKPSTAGMAEMAKKLKVLATGDTVTMNLRLTREEMEHATRLYQASLKKTPRKPLASLDLTVEPQPIPAPPKMVIKIEGLDGGTREVPFAHQ